MERLHDIVFWNAVKSKLKKEYPVLTNADLHVRNGMEEDFFKMIAYKLGKTRKELSEIITSMEA